MKLGTHIKLADGRVGTVIYNSLIGVGIKWGIHNPDPADFEGTTGNTVDEEPREDWPWEPDALLRAPFKGCEKYGMECVGTDYEAI
jgi:hypothetical protein